MKKIKKIAAKVFAELAAMIFLLGGQPAFIFLKNRLAKAAYKKILSF